MVFISVIKRFSQNLYVLPALAVFLLAGSSGDFFARVNIHKTFLLFAASSLLFVFILLFRARQDDQPPLLSSGWLLFLSLPLLAALPGLVMHGGNFNYLLGHEIAIHLVYLVWLICFCCCIRNFDDLFKFFVMVGLAVVYVVINGFVQGGDRPASSFGNTTLYANFLITVIPLYLVMALPLDLGGKGRNFSLKGFSLPASLYFSSVVVIGFIGLWQSQTRSAVFSLIFAIAALVFFLLFRYLKLKYAVRGPVFIGVFFGLLLVGVASFCFIVSGLDHEVVASSRFLQLGTVQAWTNRFMPYQVAVNSIYESPLFGYGPGSSYNLFFEYLPGDSRLYALERSFKHVHNELLEVCQEGGFVGLATHLFMLVSLFWLAMQQLKSDKLNNHAKKLVLGAVLALGSYNCHGMFSLATRMTQNEMTMYMMVAVLIVLLPHAGLAGGLAGFLQWPRFEVFSGPTPRPGRLTSFSACCLGLLLMAWFLEFPYFQGSRQLAMVGQSRIRTVADIEALTEKYQDSPSIYVLKYLASLQVSAKNGESLSLLLHKVDSKIANYQDSGYLRIMEYVINHGKDLDLTRLKKIIQNYHHRDRYHGKTILWLARLAAFENDSSVFIEQVGNTARLTAVRNQLLHADDADNLIVRSGDQEAGVQVNYRPRQIEIILSKGLVAEMMANARILVPKNKQPELVYSYLKDLKQIPPSDDSDSFLKSRRDLFVRQLFRQIAAWSTAPD